MKNATNMLASLLVISLISSCTMDKTKQIDASKFDIEVYETSADGNQMTKVDSFIERDEFISVEIKPENEFQTITGFGGSFTEASAYLLNQLSEKNRKLILEAYFSETGANYSLTRTHMNSCDFSLSNYSYAPVPGDKMLENFSIEEDRDDIIPMIKEAMAISKDGFKILASPWTAPPWMKNNKDWRGGKLLPAYYDTWALFFSKYFEAYKDEGIDIWGFTVENEPLGNSNNWESMHFTAEEMTHFVQNYLGPRLESDSINAKILGYDQNRGDELKHWIDVMFKDEASSKYYDGTAVHWYASTYDYFPASLQYAHEKAPEKHLIQSEGCVDAEVPRWKDDKFYWSKESTDWGWDWAPEEQKYLHPKYAPVNRYARDMIGCLNNYVDGWIDWNMVLDRQGGPNWFKNWCIAPIIVDPELDEVYFTPIYYTMVHFSKFIRPGAKRIDFELSEEGIMLTAAKNQDGSIAVVVFNEEPEEKVFELKIGEQQEKFSISGQAVQTIFIQGV